jgi:transcriptional regulator with XRE-family HTH domain
MANLTPLACRAARALLEMSARELGEKAGVAFETINKFENGRPMRESTKAKLTFVLESAGVEILNGNAPGARLRSIIPEERVYTPEEEDALRNLAKVVDALDAFEDAGVPDLGEADLAKLTAEARDRLMNDPRMRKDDAE